MIRGPDQKLVALYPDILIWRRPSGAVTMTTGIPDTVRL